MPRKSLSRRLEESRALLEGYNEKNLQSDYRSRFIRDMVVRMDAGRNMSSKQRNWLDSLIEEGPPIPKGDPVLIEKINAAIELRGMEHRKSVLQDFLGRISTGRDLSEKQVSFLNGMIEESERVKIDGPYCPDDDVIERLTMCVKLSKSYSRIYWETHAGTSKALTKVSEWLEDNDSAIDEWSVKKVLGTMSAKIREIYESPYATEGEILWMRGVGGSKKWNSCLILSGPHVNENGNIVYTVLCDGDVSDIGKNGMSKRRMSA